MPYTGRYIEILDKNSAVIKVVSVLRDTDKDVPVTELGVGGSLVDSANPLPTVAEGIYEAALGDNFMELPVPGLSAWVEKNERYTATVAGDPLWTPAAGKVFVCRQIMLEWDGANDGSVIVWSSASSAADTTYSAGTDRLILLNRDAEPSTKGSGGIGPVKGLWVGQDAEYPLRVTITNNLNCDVAVAGWEYTLP